MIRNFVSYRFEFEKNPSIFFQYVRKYDIKMTTET